MSTAVSVLMALVPVGLNWVIETYDWRTAWLVAGVTIWAVVVPIARYGIVDRPEVVGQFPDGGARPDAGDAVHAPTRSWSRPEAMRTARFWVLSAASAAAAMLVTALTFHQISLLGEIGLSSTAAAAMFLPQVIGAAVAGLVFGALADRVAGKWLLSGSMVLLAGATVLAWLVVPGWVVFVYAVVLGAAGGSIRSTGAALLPRWFGTRFIGSLQGFVTFLVVGASATGPVALSLARTATGEYGSAALLATLLPAGLALGALVLAREGT
ncbi:MAG: MFS transporter, partial [Acidimicrobiia bacterium]|nr:MFS transporter [Acidimicrobiia bacterium]